MRVAIAYPCMGPRSSVLRMSMSSVPGSSSPAGPFLDSPISILWECRERQTRCQSGMFRGADLRQHVDDDFADLVHARQERVISDEDAGGSADHDQRGGDARPRGESAL